MLEMIVGETVGYTVVASRYGLSDRRAKKLLLDALDLWPGIIGPVCREIDEADLDRMHAALA